MNSRINHALAALHNITAFKRISTLVLAIAALNASNACAMWHPYPTTIRLQDGANTIEKNCFLGYAFSETPQSILDVDRAQCDVVCNDLMRNQEFRALVLDNSTLLWVPGTARINQTLGVRPSSDFGCPTLAVTSSRFGYSPSRLFIQKNLSEHGKNGESCTNNDEWTFTKLIRAIREEDGTVQCLPCEIVCNNNKTVNLSRLCRIYRNNNVIDLNDQDIVTMATHHCKYNKIVTQRTLLGIRKFRRGTLLTTCVHPEVLRIVCAYIERATLEDIVGQVPAENRAAAQELLAPAQNATENIPAAQQNAERAVAPVAPELAEEQEGDDTEQNEDGSPFCVVQ